MSARYTLAVLLLGIAALLMQPVRAQMREPPVLEAVLAWRDGHLVVDAEKSVLGLRTHKAVYTACGLSAAGVKAELVGYLDGVLRNFGPAFERLVIPPAQSEEGQERRRRVEPAFRDLQRTDADTRSLTTLSAHWAEGDRRIRAWWQQNRNREPAVAMGQPAVSDLYKAAEFHALLADGPLLPVRKDSNEPPADEHFRRGQIDFRLAPPLLGTDSRLRPELNVSQWDKLRQGLAEQALAPLRCRLWYRQRVVDSVQDYLELRGLSAQPYRAPRDSAERTGLDDPSPHPAPVHHAGIAPERPRFADDGSFGGRVLLLPDPLVKTVFVETSALGDAALWPALYLLLPSSDLAELRASLEARPDGLPQRRYLCRTHTVWKAPVEGRPPTEAVRLDLDGAAGQALVFSRQYLTPRELALRLQRLAVIGYRASINFTEDERDRPERRRLTKLIVEPIADAVSTPAPGRPLNAAIPACTEAPPPVPGAGLALPDPDAADHLQPAPARRDPSRAAAPRNEFLFSAEKPAGKPLSLGVGYSHDGLQPGDRFSIGFGHQRRPSTEASYSSDFVGFDRWHRRLQLSARAFSTQQADRPLQAERLDERREGAELRATLDLWRDLRGSFAQAELGLSRALIKPAGSNEPSPQVVAADVTLVVVREAIGTSSSPHAEALLSLGRGRSAGHGFDKAGVELGYHGFVAAFERLDLRLRAAGVGSAAPVSEWVAFGGEDSVRGYRSEWALVRRAVSLQSEYWRPLPWAPAAESIARALRRNVALALFADLGTLSPALPAQARWHAGAGLGLRYQQVATAQRLTLRLDLARPLRVDGTLPPDARRARLHFSVSTQRFL